MRPVPSPRMLNQATRLGRVSRWWGRTQARVLRLSNGRLLRRWVGLPVLVLETVGRRSGRPHATTLLRFDDGDDFLVVAANAGSDRAPAWFLNLRAAGEATVVVGGDRFPVRAEVLDPDQLAKIWPALLEVYPGLDEYRGFTDREIPVVRLRRLPG